MDTRQNWVIVHYFLFIICWKIVVDGGDHHHHQLPAVIVRFFASTNARNTRLSGVHFLDSIIR